MKTLLFAVVVCSFGVALGEGQAPAPTTPEKAVESVQGTAAKKVTKAKMTVEQRKAALEKRRQAREEKEKAAAKKAGMTLEQYRADHKAKRDAIMAKRLGMTVEDYSKLTIDERRIKFAEMTRKACEAKQTKPSSAVPVPEKK